MISGGTPGTKSVNVKFREIKLTKVMRNLPLFERDSNKWILRGESRKTVLSTLVLYIAFQCDSFTEHEFEIHMFR